MQKKQIINNLLLAIFIIFLSTGCSTKNSVYKIDNKVLTLGKNESSLVSINFTNAQIQRNTSRCVLDSYTLFDRNHKYGNLFIESISLESSCSWNGSAIGFFESNLKRNLNINMSLVEEFDYSGYSFRTYKVDDDSYLNVIYIYTNGDDRFILDYYGRLYDKVIKTFNPNYKNKYLAKKRFIGDYQDSLVRRSLVNDYFERERIEIIPRIGISISL